MFLQTLWLFPLFLSGLAVDPSVLGIHNVSGLVDDFLEFIYPILRFNGHTEIKFDDISTTDHPVNLKHIDSRLINTPKLREYLGSNTTIPFSFSCEDGKLGDITTLRRSAPATERLEFVIGLFVKFISIRSHFTLEKLYVRFSKCEFTLGDARYKGKLTLEASKNDFKTDLKLVAIGDTSCGLRDKSTPRGNEPLVLKPVVTGTPLKKIIEKILTGIFKKYAKEVKKLTNEKLIDAFSDVIKTNKLCDFLHKRNKPIKHH
ncbi:hypothetical protein GE061_007014 [Apolygus lucorum]|uniref:Uncharacterized protein n=1 Tax=Apolygus lucorum TaxID=248454 RepID=A0A8S9WS96_APOLU|nr:hypothetical protein GE061_007014 [Apolygus lucorum]